MFSILPILSIALAVASSASGLIIPRHRAINLPARSEPTAAVTQPATYDAGYLEAYNTYHIRYLALDCQDKHNTTFFDTCCHPLLANESLSSRPAECTPTASQSSSASSALPTSTVVPDAQDDVDCEEGDDDKSSTHTSKTTEAPKATGAPKDTGISKNVAQSPPEQSPKESSSKTDSSTASKATATSKSTTSSSGSSGLSGAVNTGGVATFFTQNGNAGACGTVHQDSDFICAIDQDRYGNSGEKSPLCGKQIHIVNKSNGKSVTVIVADDCPTCDNANSIDLSVGAFTQIATEAEGEVDIEWSFV